MGMNKHTVISPGFWRSPGKVLFDDSYKEDILVILKALMRDQVDT